MKRIDRIDKKLLELVQDDLPAGKRPFDAWAKALGIEPGELISRLELLRRRGIIRSVKAILRHRQAGFSSGAMVVWAVPGDQVDRVGLELASRQEISHCYERPGFGEYNLFSMIHGRTDDEVLRIIGEISSAHGIGKYRVYWSLRELKKSSMNYVREGSGEEC